MITPQTEHPELAQALGVPTLYLKREDLHPYGSHKGRSIPYMIDTHANGGAPRFALSSSGNAALAAIRHIQKRNSEKKDGLKLTVFIGKNINPEKKARLEKEITDSNIELIEIERPLQKLFEFIKTKMVVSLRQSTDAYALIGYKSLSEEMYHTPDLEAVFVPTSSGTTAEALAHDLPELGKKASVHIVQTTSCHPLAETFDTERNNEDSIADAIVDKTVYRRGPLLKTLQANNGAGWIVTNDEIQAAMNLIKEKTGIETTPNGALGIAGLMRALATGRKFTGAVVCIITGK